MEVPITIADLGEFGLIAAIAERLPSAPGVVLGPGDDAAVLSAPDGRVVATTDLLIEGRHFRRNWSGPSDIGRKAAARNLADVAAMGARPTALLVAFAGPGELELAWVLDLVTGLAEECSEAGAAVAGGDTSSATTVMLAITALGDLAGRAPVTRSGARPGDQVAIAGTAGSAAAGLALLSAGLAREAAVTDERAVAGEPVVAGEPAVAGQFAVSGEPAVGGLAVAGEAAVPRESADAGAGAVAELIAAHRRPRPPYAAGPQAAALGATSMIDVSDGLLGDLGHVARASGVRLELQSGPLSAEPVARAGQLAAAARVLAAATGSEPPDWLGWVLTGGDDHALAATFPPGVVLPAGWTVIGSVTEGSGVLVDGREWLAPAGWEHFRS